jgi:hypothetical protein
VLAPARDQAATVVNQVDLTKPRAIFGPVGPGADRNALLEQSAGFGEAASLPLPRSISDPEAIHRGRTHLEQILVAGGTDAEDTGLVQSRQLHINGRA